MSIKRLFFSLLSAGLVTFWQAPAYADVSFQAKAFLSGAYDPNTGLMRDDLRAKGYLPTTQPYSIPPFNYSGKENVTSARLSISDNTAIVDWMLIELRDKNDNAVVGAQKAVLIQKNGQLYDTTTQSNTINFKGFEPDYYRVSISHRMHLGVTIPPVLLSESLVNIDFSSPLLTTEGTNAQQNTNNIALLWAGDIDQNNSITTEGVNNERNHLAAQILLAETNTKHAMSYRLEGYYNSDLNMDGVTISSGPDNDINVLQSTIINHPLNKTGNTNFIVAGKLPVGQVDYLGSSIKSGDLAAQISTTDLVNEFYKSVDETTFKRQATHREIFVLNDDGTLNSNSITNLSWNPTHDSITFDINSVGTTFPILVSNAAIKSATSNNLILGAAGIRSNGAQYAVLGTNIFHDLKHTTEPGGIANINMQLFSESLINWLTQKSNLKSTTPKIVLAHIADSYWFKHDATTRLWFTQAYPNANVNLSDTCESALLKNCLSGADLLVISREDGSDDKHGIPFDQSAVLSSVKAAQALGVPVLYVPFDGTSTAFSTALLDYFGVTSSDNYWRQEVLTNFDPSSSYHIDYSNLSSLRNAVETINNPKLDFDYNTINCPDNVGRTDCKPNEIIEKNSGKSLNQLFYSGVVQLKNSLSNFDNKGKDLFSLDSGYNPLKMAVLLGDQYRANIKYPMDKLKTNDNDFLKAVFADHATTYRRSNNTTQITMGDFSPTQSDLNKVVGGNKVFSYKPTSFTEWTSTGIYALPGRTITIKRTDNTSTNVKIKFNYLRDRTTRHWNTNQYSRPLFMTSPDMIIAPNSTQTFSTPYGGPIYIGWDAAGIDNPESFTIDFENVISHPLLKSFDDTSIQAYLDDLKNTPTDWTDIKTPFAEVHSLKSYMFTAFAKHDGNKDNGYTLEDVKQFITDLNQYLIAGNYGYAGFNGVGLPDLNQEVLDFCLQRGFTQASYDGVIKNLCTDPVIHAKPKIQHINTDINAQCGALCAGNPFDSYTPLEPFGWGENHEMGHNLQRARLKIYDGRSTEVSNNIFPMHTLWQSTLDKNLSSIISKGRPAYKKAYEILQSAIKSNTPASSNHPLWSGTGTYDNAFERLGFYIQLVYSQQSWSFYTKLYLVERIFTDAIKTDVKWSDAKILLGMSNYNRIDASTVSAADFMYLGASLISGKNYSDYFEKWGIDISQTAKDQVLANGITEPAPAVMYYVHDVLPVAMPSQEDALPLDGIATWVDPTP